MKLQLELKAWPWGGGVRELILMQWYFQMQQQLQECFFFYTSSNHVDWLSPIMFVYAVAFCGGWKTSKRVVFVFAADIHCVIYSNFDQTRTLGSGCDHVMHEWVSKHMGICIGHALCRFHTQIPRLCVNARLLNKRRNTSHHHLLLGIHATFFCVLWIDVGQFKHHVL